LSVGDSFCSEFAGAGYPINGEDDAHAFFHGAVVEEVDRSR